MMGRLGAAANHNPSLAVELGVGSFGPKSKLWSSSMVRHQMFQNKTVLCFVGPNVYIWYLSMMDSLKS